VGCSQPLEPAGAVAYTDFQAVDLRGDDPARPGLTLWVVDHRYYETPYACGRHPRGAIRGCTIKDCSSWPVSPYRHDAVDKTSDQSTRRNPGRATDPTHCVMGGNLPAHHPDYRHKMTLWTIMDSSA
jgi:hypothetical protein